MKAFSLLAMILIAGCDSAPGVVDSPMLELPASHMKDHGGALRVKRDTVRDRQWALGFGYVDVYDRQTNRLIRRVDLPPWTVAGFVCPPDIAFDRTGSAYISHNVEPRLWQIDADSFQLKEHALQLLQREHLDIGLTKLTFAPDGALFAVGSSGGSQWRIDLDSATAQLVDVEAPDMDECTFQ